MRSQPRLHSTALISAALCLALPVLAQAASVDPRRAHGAAVVLDTHFDTPANFS
ncbi:MAG: hypothetical protein IM654_06495, partial [Phenylobacterium sp.]|nr:hypothetical protein [Phenylobacterium sp.]